MTDTTTKSLPKIGKGLRGARRRNLTSAAERVREESLGADAPDLLLLQPAVDGVDLVDWAETHRDRIEETLRTRGGILFRGFDLGGVEGFERLVAAVAGSTLEYEDRTSPRSEVSGNVYTSTDFPQDQTIFLHNENSYSHTFPQKIAFHCVVAADEGGRTPVADCRRIYQRLPEELRRRFEAEGVVYVRNFGDGLGLPWQQVFGSDERAEVEAFCRRSEIEWEWKPGNRLRTRQRRPATLLHPDSGERVWFNQAPLFHVSMLDEEMRRELLASFAPDELPSNVYYGDGSEIPQQDLARVRAAYEAEERSFPWQEGDVMLLDNLLLAHGRTPYRGERKIVVGMGQPRTWDDRQAGTVR